MARMCPGVSTQMARAVGWAVRDTLNQYLTLSRQHRLSRRGRLLRLLDQHPDRPQLTAWLREHGGLTDRPS
jgi:hypothetical protein